MSRELYVKTREEWRRWLQKNHDKVEEVWLIYYKKCTQKPRIPYDDAVEEAICFGWIDGQIKKIDEQKFMQRFTPRREGSIWSIINIKRAEKMVKQGRMTPVGMAKFKNLKKEVILPKTLPVPADLKQALARDTKAQENWKKFPESIRKAYTWWVIDSKKDDTRKTRIKKVVEKAKNNKKPWE